MNTKEILQSVAVVVFLGAGMMAPVAAACVDCSDFIVDRPQLGLHEVQLLKCRVSIATLSTTTTVGEDSEACSVTCNHCSDPGKIIGASHKACDLSYPDLQVLGALCPDTADEGGIAGSIHKDEDGNYHLPGGELTIEVACENSACSGPKVFVQKTPITYTNTFQITRQKSAYCCPIGSDDDRSTWQICFGTREERKTLTQTVYLIGADQTKSVCTDEQVGQCVVAAWATTCDPK